MHHALSVIVSVDNATGTRSQISHRLFAEECAPGPRLHSTSSEPHALYQSAGQCPTASHSHLYTSTRAFRVWCLNIAPSLLCGAFGWFSDCTVPELIGCTTPRSERKRQWCVPTQWRTPMVCPYNMTHDHCVLQWPTLMACPKSMTHTHGVRKLQWRIPMVCQLQWRIPMVRNHFNDAHAWCVLTSITHTHGVPSLQWRTPTACPNFNDAHPWCVLTPWRMPIVCPNFNNAHARCVPPSMTHTHGVS